MAVAGDTTLTGVAGWAVGMMDHVGAAGAGAVVALENVFPPIPSEVILPLAGFTAGQGRFTVWSAIAWTTVGSVVGALVLYAVGALLGRERSYRVWARIPLAKVSELEATEAWFTRHGRWAVLLGRMLPIFRSLISLPAGVTRMPLAEFVALTAVGSAIWNSVFIVLGYHLGAHWHRVERYAAWLTYAVVAGVVVAIVWWLVRRLRAWRVSTAR